ncbi:MAG: 50S ribosomal protein L18 [Candidatus Pacearchaeota archaeon]|nr:50S ribosomal protein L18 [Candidatus Pacearchaeota archaeon]
MKTIKRRRREAKTDYRNRLVLLKSQKPRLVIRKTNRYIIAQIVVSEIAQDKIIVGLTSKVLLEKGWPRELSGSLKSLSAAYLTGFLVGKMAQKQNITSAILDIGMNRNIQKSRLFAALKGAIDSGLKIPHNPDCLPPMEMIKKEKISKIFDKIIGE